ncbi:hypothetical protein DSECCO2_513240 [anaerobic digester metagenome]
MVPFVLPDYSLVFHIYCYGKEEEEETSENYHYMESIKCKWNIGNYISRFFNITITKVVKVIH